MKTLQGIISKGVKNGMVQFETFGYQATNASNISTPGYKAVRFESVLSETGRVSGELRRDYSVGSFSKTGRDFDVCISGPGFIPITDKEGNVSYTRDGSFKLNSEGYLVSTDGSIVGSGIKIPPNYDKLKIRSNGDVEVFENYGKPGEKIGEIPLLTFTNPEGLEVLDGNKVLPTKDSGEPILLVNHDYIKQGGVEASNVNIWGTVTDMMQMNASLLATTNVIKLADNMYMKAINLRQ